MTFAGGNGGVGVAEGRCACRAPLLKGGGRGGTASAVAAAAAITATVDGCNRGGDCGAVRVKSEGLYLGSLCGGPRKTCSWRRVPFSPSSWPVRQGGGLRGVWLVGGRVGSPTFSLFPHHSVHAMRVGPDAAAATDAD